MQAAPSSVNPGHRYSQHEQRRCTHPMDHTTRFRQLPGPDLSCRTSNCWLIRSSSSSLSLTASTRALSSAATGPPTTILRIWSLTAWRHMAHTAVAAGQVSRRPLCSSSVPHSTRFTRQIGRWRCVAGADTWLCQAQDLPLNQQQHGGLSHPSLGGLLPAPCRDQQGKMGLAACFALQTVLAKTPGWLAQLLGRGMLCWVVLRGLCRHLLEHLLVAAAQAAAAALACSCLMQAAAVAAREWTLMGPCLAPAAHVHGNELRKSVLGTLPAWKSLSKPM